MLDGPRDSSNDYRPENSPPFNTFNRKKSIRQASKQARFSQELNPRANSSMPHCAASTKHRVDVSLEMVGSGLTLINKSKVVPTLSTDTLASD